MKKPIKVLVMSVGQYDTNYTAKYIERIGGKSHCTIVLPKQYEENAISYKERGFDVFLYDEKKYINEDFEFFGFKPRNCGGIGRQGIAEAVERYGDEYLCWQVDDDYQSFSVKDLEKSKRTQIRSWRHLEAMIYAEQEFSEKTGIEIAAKTGATIFNKGYDDFVSNRKIFNNFIMKKGRVLNFTGFKCLCSDDQRYNIYVNLLESVPMISTFAWQVGFHQNQGDRSDGNAVLYNEDCSWKKSFALKMMCPWAVAQKINREEKRVLFREYIEVSKLYPPIHLEKDGEIVGILKKNGK